MLDLIPCARVHTDFDQVTRICIYTNADVDEIPVPYVLNLLRHCDGPTWPVWLYSRFFNFRSSWECAETLNPKPKP